MTGITTAALITALALSLATTSAFANTTSKAKTRHAGSVTTSVKTQAKKPALEAARGISNCASIEQPPDLPGYPPAQPAQ